MSIKDFFSLFCCACFISNNFLCYAQNKFIQPNFLSTGGTRSDAGTQRLHSVIGQPTSVSSVPRSQTQAGFLQVVDYVIIDDIPPQLVFTGGNTKINKQAPPTLSATITDNIPTGLSARIYYRKIADEVWNDELMVPGSNNTFSATVSNSWFDALGMEYYLEATDATPNVTRSPSSGSYYAYVTSDEETFPSDRIGFGNRTQDYKIIAYPYPPRDVNSNSATNLFNELGAFTNTKWRMATYNNAADNFMEYPGFTSLTRGVGYWVLVKTPEEIKVGPVDAPTENRNNLFVLNLKPGWNMIGNPYPVRINWNDVRTLNNNPNLGELKVFDSGFANATIVEPYQGGFVRLEGSSEASIKIPFLGQTVEGGRYATDFTSDISKSNWLIGLTLKQNDFTNRLSGFGMHDEALISYDQFDDVNPPQYLNAPEINFPKPGHHLKNFSRDVLPSSSVGDWQFVVSGEAGSEAVLSWPEIAGDTEQELILFDRAQVELKNMKQVSEYRFTLTNQHRFSIHFGKKAAQRALSEIMLIKPYPNPAEAGQYLHIKAALPAKESSYQVSLWLYNGNGQLLMHHEKSVSEGVNEITYLLEDGINSGMCYYRVAVRSSTTIKTITGKLIIL